MSQLICYCYNYTEDDIREDVHRNRGRSLLLERITTEKQRGNCRCTLLHPESR
ncbi:MAG: BFD-like (2Fe-2S) protein [Desulfuromonas sp.]|nr:MAG: BFD-like (2Fe-2S) protein [Desulfuromonas sp.]